MTWQQGDGHATSGEQHAREPRAREQEVLDAGGDRVGLAERWSALPPRRRRVLAAGVAAGLTATMVGAGWHPVHEWLQERSLSTQVDVEAAFEVQSWSSPFAGDRVNFFVDLRNTGPRPVRVTALAVDHPRLRVRNRTTPRAPIPAGSTLLVPLSVLLDCTDPRARTPQQALRGSIAISPSGGGTRTVPVSVDRANLLTDVADTLCRIYPRLRDAELSGPVGQM